MPIDSTYVESGTSLGSNEVAFLKKPRVLLAWDTPTSSLSAGWTRYVLERRFGAAGHDRAHGIARARHLRRVRRHGAAVGQLRGADRRRRAHALKDWIRAGGTLVTLAEATRWATGSSVGLLDTTALLKDGKPDVPPGTGAGQAGRGG